MESKKHEKKLMLVKIVRRFQVQVTHLIYFY